MLPNECPTEGLLGTDICALEPGITHKERCPNGYVMSQGPSGRLLDFLPLSDFTFNDMREALLAEYAAATAEPEAAPTACCR